MISVIVPVYNVEKYLPKCLDSILRQDCQDFEVLLIDDGSTDQSDEICDNYAKLDARVRVTHKPNGGSGSARNVGLGMARGKYIAFVDADDFVAENYLSRLLTVAEANHADIVQCQFQCVVENEQPAEHSDAGKIEKIYSNIESLKEFCKKSGYLSTAVMWNKLYRKELFYDIHYQEGKGVDDEYVICPILYRANRIIVISDVLYYYYMSGNSQMRNTRPTLKKLDGIDAIEKQLAFFEQISQPQLRNMLMYRYYSGVVGGYNYVKKYFPAEREILLRLKEKKKGMWSALRLKEMSLSDKLLLVSRNCCPNLFKLVHRKIKGV